MACGKSSDSEKNGIIRGVSYLVSLMRTIICPIGTCETSSLLWNLLYTCMAPGNHLGSTTYKADLGTDTRGWKVRQREELRGGIVFFSIPVPVAMDRRSHKVAYLSSYNFCCRG